MSDFKITGPDDAAGAIPRPLRVGAALSWRLLVILGALYVLGMIVSRLFVVVIPVAIALLLAALLAPAVGTLARYRVPRALSTAVVLVGGLGVVGGVLTFVINAFIEGFPQLQAQVVLSLNGIRDWLSTGPLHLNDQQITTYVEQAEEWLKNNQATLTQGVTSGVLTTAGTFGNFLTGLLLALFTLIFFLYDGRRVWLFVIRIAPADNRDRVDRAGSRGFASLVGYVRATALVAVVDAVGIWIGLVAVGVPLAVPLAALVFLGGFVPIVGAVASGAVAVLVALVTKGWIAALIVLGVVLAVQQIEGNVLQPLLLGRAVQLHALAVVLAISVGVVISGIIGALLAVPLVAVLNSAIRSLTSDEVEGVLPPPESEDEAEPEGTEEPPESEDKPS
ncbi:AI-2E family transporter [Saccharopolyspora erythraea]|uniref:AI-2E family transporter n=1 Tax=Saccharopolyspora erythraea TaxID=1836 RepID=UPI001BA70A8C|nr:AI-2E family transporter [Saccharopolyspora erythraea]QUH05643.1 AI-2E family transporter [Saccharopolyspora erythraea]